MTKGNPSTGNLGLMVERSEQFNRLPREGEVGRGGPQRTLPGEPARPVQGRSMMQEVGSCESRWEIVARVFQP